MSNSVFPNLQTGHTLELFADFPQFLSMQSPKIVFYIFYAFPFLFLSQCDFLFCHEEAREEQAGYKCGRNLPVANYFQSQLLGH